MKPTARDILTAAADLIEERGEITRLGDYYDPDRDCYCALGAIAKVSGYRFDSISQSVNAHLVGAGGRVEAAQRLAEHLGMQSWYEIPAWNDHMASDWQDVVVAMREAADS